MVIMMNEYKTQLDLYKGLIPALNVKLRLLKNKNYTNIKKEDIWNYLKETKWKTSINLTLADMVQDIIHTDNEEIFSYFNQNKKENKESKV